MPAPPLSTFSASLTIPAAELARLLDKATATRIADLRDKDIRCSIGRCRLNLTASRTGAATVSAENGELGIRMPFTLHAEMATSGFLSFLHAKGDADGLAVARTDIAVRPDWTLGANTTGEVQLGNGHLRVGPVVTNVAQLWNDNEESLSRPLWHLLDAQIARIDVKSRIAALWARTFQPIRVGKAPLSWLVLTPESLGVSQPVIRDGAVSLSLGLAARGRVLVQDQAPQNLPTPLPRAISLSASSDQFSFAVPLVLPYGRASELAAASLGKKPPRLARMNLRFTKIQILPSGQDVVVGARFCADPDWDFLGWFASCGTVYLRGAPQFDSHNRTFRVARLHYDIASADLMLGAFHALAGERLSEALQSHLVFDEARQIDRLETEIATALAKPQGRDVTLSAKVESFRRTQLRLDGGRLCGDLLGQGTRRNGVETLTP